MIKKLTKKWILNNFKMYAQKKNYQAYKELINANAIPYMSYSKQIQFEYIFFPSFLFLENFQSKISQNFIHSGAQNIYHESIGPYTGEISASMLCDINIDYVLIGHSERRKHLNENKLILEKKILLALKNKLKVILCIGEENMDLNQVEIANFFQEELNALLSKAFLNEENINNKIMIAYEPIWSIGKDEAASIQMILKRIQLLKKELSKFISNQQCEFNILYGGSVNSDNIEEIISQEAIDGVLLGRSCIDSIQWIEMIKKIEKIF